MNLFLFAGWEQYLEFVDSIEVLLYRSMTQEFGSIRVYELVI